MLSARKSLIPIVNGGELYLFIFVDFTLKIEREKMNMKEKNLRRKEK